MKKRLFGAILAMILSFSAMSIPVFAHGMCMRGGYYNAQYGHCSYANCRLSYTHMHNGQYYYGHTMNDGHRHNSLIYR